jgi:fructokinase
MNKPIRIGVDLGGTKIEAIALDGAGQVRVQRRVPTPAGDYPGIVRALVDLVEGIERALGTRGTVGIGTPGALSPSTGLLRNSNSVCLNGKPLDQDLAGALGRPVRLANDANCFVLSEAIEGAAIGARVVLGVILGTGTGGGIVVNGQILTGPNAIAGEWGHNPLPWPREGEWPGAGLLLRQERVHRDLSLRAGDGTGALREHGRAPGCHRDRPAGVSGRACR